MKQSTLLVGGGVIARHYRKGLEQSQTLRLVGLVDPDPACLARSSFSVPFFTNLQDALALRPRVALLALPVAPRACLARKLLAQGIAVLTEKPMFSSLEEIASLTAYADECGVPLACLFHWKTADEVRFLKENRARFGAIKAISTTINDDYAATPDGTIRQDRVGLSGAWFDSGINVLSYYDELIDLTSATLQEETLVPDPTNGLPKYARKVFTANGVRAEIVVDWQTRSREKTSRIECEHGTLEVSHTAQTVKWKGETVFARPVQDRLSSHYENLFARLSPEEFAREQDHVLLLHKLLYTGNAR